MQIVNKVQVNRVNVFWGYRVSLQMFNMSLPGFVSAAQVLRLLGVHTPSRFVSRARRPSLGVQFLNDRMIFLMPSRVKLLCTLSLIIMEGASWH